MEKIKKALQKINARDYGHGDDNNFVFICEEKLNFGDVQTETEYWLAKQDDGDSMSFRIVAQTRFSKKIKQISESERWQKSYSAYENDEALKEMVIHDVMAVLTITTSISKKPLSEYL